jgi:RNA polymerase sigma-70 factor (ECF subfamily)
MSIETTQYNCAEKLFVDEKSFTEFYNQYQWFVWKIAYNITFCVDSAHDIRQDVFFKLWIKRHQIDPVQNIKAYIAKYTYMRALNVVGLNKYSTQRNQYFTEGNSQYIDPMNAIEARLMCEQVRKTAVKILPKQCKKVYQLAIERDMFYLDIAKELQLTPSTIKNQKVRALRLIKEVLGSEIEFASIN